MKRLNFPVVVFAGVALLLIAWMVRYSTSAPNQSGYYTVLDRWTGATKSCHTSEGC